MGVCKCMRHSYIEAACVTDRTIVAVIAKESERETISIVTGTAQALPFPGFETAKSKIESEGT